MWSLPYHHYHFYRTGSTQRSTMDSATLGESNVSPTTDDKHPGLTADARFRYWVIHCCLSKKSTSYQANLDPKNVHTAASLMTKL